MQTTIHETLRAAYEEVEYTGGPIAPTSPDRLAAIAALFGLAPADPATARVLEIGCGDGANLLPWAARFPKARFTGCDASARLMARARTMVDGLGLANVDLVEGDLRTATLPGGDYDYIVAHGFYSWVPPDVRDAFLALARRRLAPGGLVLASYNVLPGCHLRRIGWDAIRLENLGATTARERLEGARRIRRDLAEAWTAAGGGAAALAEAIAAEDERGDGQVYHDDVSAMNDPVYFTAFVRHAAAHGLAFLAEAELGLMGALGLPPAMQQLLAASDPIAREQYLDFARVRRFRQSLLVAAGAQARAKLSPHAIDSLHATAWTGRSDGEAGGGPASEALARRHPSSVPVRELLDELQSRGASRDEARAVVVRECFAGSVVLRAHPLATTRVAPERPRAFAVARWQAARGDDVTNLLHEGVRVDEPEARTLLAALDGTRDRASLAALLGGHADSRMLVDRVLARFAEVGLLEA